MIAPVGPTPWLFAAPQFLKRAGVRVARGPNVMNAALRAAAEGHLAFHRPNGKSGLCSGQVIADDRLPASWGWPARGSP